MPKTGHKPSPEQSRPLADFMKQAISEQGISLRTAAKQIGIDIAFLCRIVNGENTPNAHVCNLIADYFELPRVQVYALAGWLPLGDVPDTEVVSALNALFPDPGERAEVEKIYFNIGDGAARARYLQILQKLKTETHQMPTAS